MNTAKVILEGKSDSPQSRVPVTFGQVFAKGDFPAGMSLEGMQVDAKAFHEDGSVRHAVVSMLADLPAKASQLVYLRPVPRTLVKPIAAGSQTAISVQITIDGEVYTATNKGDGTTWLSGEVVTETRSSSALKKEDGTPHPHLNASFDVRSYHGTSNTRAAVGVENCWAYENNPRNFTYDVAITIGGKVVFEKKSLLHFHHARWRELFWTGDEPQVHVVHDTAYLIATRALPNYDQSVVVPEKALAALAADWVGAKTEPMGIGAAEAYMPGTGGRGDIGLLPEWAASYLLSMDARAKRVTLGTADRAGSWSMHYRDKNTGRPISLIDYPYMTILGNPGDTKNPKTGLREAFPSKVPNASSSPYKHDTAHQPNFAYLPYLVTGDYYYLEELQFWAMYDAFASNPGWRHGIKGLVADDQVRAQAWSLRAIGEAAYITPDNDRLKEHFVRVLMSNLEWYNAKYSNNPEANKLGLLITGAAAVGYKDGVATAPWQDDFFTSAVGHLVDLGFKDAEPLLRYKAQFPIQRMVGEGVDFILAANYTYTVRATPKSPIFEKIEEAYRATVGPERAAMPIGSPELAKALGQKPNDMGGYSSTVSGFPSNMQPALAYAVDVSGEAGKRAWQKFMGRAVKPDYGLGPQFAVVPRQIAADQPKEPELEKEIEPEAPVIVPPVEITPQPTAPVPQKPIKNLEPQVGDTITLCREGLAYTTTVGILIEFMERSLAEKYPILKNTDGSVGIIGKLVFSTTTL